MPTIEIPVSTYSVQQIKPNQSFGSPAHIPVQTGQSRMYLKATFDKIPPDGTITNCILRVNLQKDKANAVPLSVREPLEGWASSLTWNTQPQVGAVFDTVTYTNPLAGQNYNFNVTSWAIQRRRHGLRVDTSDTSPVWLYGSSASVQQPKLIVTYTMKPLRPSNLQPDGGYVSVARPILGFRGDDDMTEKKVEFSTNGGVSVTFATGWIVSTSMTFNPANHLSTPTPAVGGTIHWRVLTRGPEGTSDVSPWAFYTYQPLPAITIVAPGPTTNDGTPTLAWTVASQTSFKVELYNDETNDLKDNSGWRDNATRRDYTPNDGVTVPGKTGRFELSIHDSFVPRVVAPGAPVVAHKKFKFTTVSGPVPPVTPPTTTPPPPIEGDPETDPNPTPEADPDSDTTTGEGNLIGTGTDAGSTATPTTLTIAYTEPVVTLSGTRTVGKPDQISLWRDGKMVTIWDADGVPFKWAPGARFFTSNTAFTIHDLTAPLRGQHTWEVKIKSGGTISGSGGPTVTETYSASSAWLVDPGTRETVEIFGESGPAIEQETAENSVLHIPINGGPIVEPVRRRITRTTKSGTVSGVVLNADDDLLLSWAEGNSAHRYRLIFGKVNWSVIIGDYIPVEVSYLTRYGPDRTAVAFSWWQRKND